MAQVQLECAAISTVTESCCLVRMMTSPGVSHVPCLHNDGRQTDGLCTLRGVSRLPAGGDHEPKSFIKVDDSNVVGPPRVYNDFRDIDNVYMLVLERN